MKPTSILLHVGPVVVAVLLAAGSGCRRSADQPADTGQGSGPVAIALTSPAFEAGQPIPAKYTEEGDDVSPPLAWSGLPEGTRELALICDDPDAPIPADPGPEPWVHWVIYKIPAGTESLPEGIAKTGRPDEPAGVLQGRNSWSGGQTIGYRGPAPPPGSGTHRYFFKLYALDTELAIEPEQDKEALLEAMSGHVLAEGRLIGSFER